MSSNSEYLIAVLDVRPCANEELKMKSVKCVEELLKYKICAAKNEYVSFVLVGTEQTSNDVNEEVFPDCYKNITQYPAAQIPSWQLLMNFFKFVNEIACDEGDWLEALVVAMEMLKRGESSLKCQRSRILLFYDFNDAPTSFDMYDVISANIAQTEVELIIVSQNIMYVDNPISGEPKAIFRDGDKSKQQLQNEDYALQLITDSNAKLFNFTEAQRSIFKVYNKRPWSWNSTLKIGSEITLNITGVIVMKDESFIKLKKCWAQDDELVKREVKCFVRGAEIEPNEMDLIDGYMLGSTPIPYDESLRDEKPQYEPGLKFVGFMKRNTIPDEYFSCESLYWIIHRQGMNVSAQKLDALVRAMTKMDMVMLCCKIFNRAFNTPKMVILLPNKLHADRPASLTMVEIAYHSQYQFFQFPRLCTPKTECTQAQYDAIDNLIDAMDLTLSSKECDAPRDTLKPDLLPFDALPHIFEQNVMDMLERKVLANLDDDDEQFAAMLEDKNFVEIFWKVPELREKRAKRAAKALRELFPLEKNMTARDKAAAAKATIKSEAGGTTTSTTSSTTSTTALDFENVRAATPASDFRQLLQQNVFTLKNRTERDSLFQLYAKQMRNIIWELLCETTAAIVAEKQEMLRESIEIYREQSYAFNAIDDYNKWITEVRAAVSKQGLHDFWQQVVVASDLGLCFVSKDTLENKHALEKFYQLEGVN